MKPLLFSQNKTMKWIYLTIAIIAEVIGTTALKSTEGFTKLVPSMVVLVAYSTTFFFLSFVLKTIPVGIAYAIWSGVGIGLIALIGYVKFGQSLDLAAMIGIAFIILGVVIINFFSKSVSP